MAARKEILSDLSTKIADGNISDAYRTFEQLPVVDQIAVSISPGVGDALAAYEVGEFGRRAKTNIQDQDRLGAAGNIALSTLSGISLIPLFRFLRGARGVTKSATKAVDSPNTLKPPVEEPLPLAPPKEPKVKLPKVEPFKPKGIEEISYQAGIVELGSKARKWVNGIEQPNITTLGKKVQKLPAEQWVQRLQNAGVPKGELRLLNILDESNSIHPKLIMSADAKKSLSRQNLDDYIARSQRDAIQVRSTPKDILESESYRPGFVNPDTQDQLNYFVKGSGELRNRPHHNNRLKYPDGKTGDNAYVFDGTGKYNAIERLGDLRPRLKPEDFKTIQDDLLELKLDPFSQGKNIFRMQSDFQEEVAKTIRRPQLKDHLTAKANFAAVAKIPRVFQEANISIKDAISAGPDAKIAGTQRTNIINNFKPEFDAALRANDEQAMRKILGDNLYKTFTDTEFGERVPGKFFAPNDELDELASVVEFIESKILTSLKGKGKSGYVELTPKNIIKMFPEGEYVLENFSKINSNFDSVVEEIFKRTKNVEKIKEKIFIGKPTGFIKPEIQKKLIKGLQSYNNEVDKVNKAIADGADIDVDRIIGSLNRDVTDLGIDDLSITPKDIERITGKPFSESLDLTPSDIFNLTDRVGDRVYKGIDFDDSNALSKAYFDDIADEKTTFFELANGVKVLKKAVGINQSQYGMKIDPYFDGGNSKYFKLPVRANILDSAKKNDDFIFIGEQQAVVEGFDPDIVKTYESAQNEIKKVLKELGVGEQGVVKTIKGTGTEFDGTYLKFTDELKKAIEEQGVNAFKDGGSVGVTPSEQELARISQAKLDEIETQLKDILGFNVYENLFQGGTLDELYQNYGASKDIKENIIDDTESKLRESLNIPYKDEIIDILQSENPKENLEQRLDVFETKQIDRALQGLNLPIDIKKTQEGIEFDKDIYAGDKFNVDFAGYKPDDGDFRGDIDIRYKDRGRFGNIDIQSTLDELGDIDTRARYGYSKGPFDVRAQKYPGRDATGDISYTLRDIDVGRNQKIGVKTIVDQLKRVKFNLDYMYNNPKTGGFIDAGLGLSSRGSPELNIGFGREF